MLSEFMGKKTVNTFTSWIISGHAPDLQFALQFSYTC